MQLVTDGQSKTLTQHIKERCSEMKRWKYELKCGKELREAIDKEEGVLDTLLKAYKELRKAKLIDKYDFERYTEDFELYDEDEDEDTIDYELSEFYDLCDALRVWIPLGWE